ncbi:hypothetical protein GCM10020254_88020 [Streptomyces goshikiensis]
MVDRGEALPKQDVRGGLSREGVLPAQRVLGDAPVGRPQRVASQAGVEVRQEEQGDDGAPAPAGPLHQPGPHVGLHVRAVEEDRPPCAQMLLQEGVLPLHGGRGDGLVARVTAADLASQGVEADHSVDRRGLGVRRLARGPGADRDQQRARDQVEGREGQEAGARRHPCTA